MNTPLHLLLMKSYHAQRSRIRPYMSSIGLSSGQPKILNYLIKHDHCMQKELASACEIEPATVSKILDNMEEADLIKREIVVENKRAFAIAITAKGKLLQKKWRKHCQEVEDYALSGFTQVEKEQFESYLCRVYKQLTDKEIE